VLSIAYVSVASAPMSAEDIEGILAVSRVNNARDGITGMLLYHRGRFVQIVEGDDEIVIARVAAIAADPRHRDVHTMRQKQIWSRQFPQWTMGFRASAGDSVALLDGYEDFFARSGRTRLQHADNEAQQFLEWLGEYWLPRTS
jgi:hypothetical protein